MLFETVYMWRALTRQNIRDLTQQDGCKTQDGRTTTKVSCKTGNEQSRATFFRHSAVLSLRAVLLRKLPIKWLLTWRENHFKSNQICFYSNLGQVFQLPEFQAKLFLSKFEFYLTIRLWARDFYRVIADEGAARVNYREIEIESE